MIDRDGIRKLMLVYGTGRLCHEFGITAPTFRKYVYKGKEPFHPPMAEHINRRVQDLLIRKPVPLAALESYVDDFANHRLSIGHESGRDYVLRYPLGHCWMRWDMTASVLWIHKNHFFHTMEKRHGQGLFILSELENLGCLVGDNKFDLLQGSGMKAQRATVNLMIDCENEHMVDVKRMLEESAKREEPDQDARVFP